MEKVKELIKEKLPSNLIEKIKLDYDENIVSEIFEGYLVKRDVSLRINALKAEKGEIIKVLENESIKYETVSWYDDALVLKDVDESSIEKLTIYEEGKIYLQNLSSMLPPLLLEPEEKKDILDMTAAPGGKTTQIAALTNNKSYITACEKNKIKAERLKYNLNKQGANAYVIEKDARDLDNFLKYDMILLDAPCSGSGTILLNNESENIRFTEEFENKLEKVQTKLLEKAINLLKKDEVMVYSTCSILRRENENIINKILKYRKRVLINNSILKQGKIEIIPYDTKRCGEIKTLPTTINGAFLVMPNEKFEGFFAIKLKKIK